MTNSYDTGRLDLPFVGISTFGKRPYQPDWSRFEQRFKRKWRRLVTPSGLWPTLLSPQEAARGRGYLVSLLPVWSLV